MRYFPTLWALPGFLGQPSDWHALSFDQLNVRSVNLYGAGFPSPSYGLEAWANHLNGLVEKDKANPRILLGYSLGGRLALQVLLSRPDLWQGAIFCSTHLGLPSEEEKKLRLQSDKEWAMRFAVDDWKELMTAWGNQPVFQGSSFRFDRQEADYLRKSLSDTLQYWSLAQQPNFSADLNALNKPILWLTGSKDTRFVALTERLKLTHSASKVQTIIDGGHRFPWEFPQATVEAVHAFLNTLTTHV